MLENAKILVVDDDPGIRELLSDYLSEQQCSVTAVASGEAMRDALEQGVPDLVLLDLNMPGEDGLTLARYLREHHDLAIIMVSGAGETVDRIVGLEVGADDYVCKPFDPRELRARIKNVLRRYEKKAPAAPESTASQLDVPEHARVPVGVCSLDLTSHQLWDAEGNEVPLTSMEFDLLKIFVERPNRPLTRDQILELTQNRDWDPYDRSIDIRISRLRQKIEADASRPAVIKTIRGVGYMFVP